jgi:hypothetical protein
VALRSVGCLVLLVVCTGAACTGTPPTRVASRTPHSGPSVSAAPATASPKLPPPSSEADTSCAKLEVKLPELIHSDLDVPVPDLEDLSEREQMTPVYEKLAALLRGRAKDSLRIAVYGDSNLTRDYITGELRRALQLEFGDGGHGYIAVGKPWNWYIHTDVRHGVDQGWKSYSMSTSQVADRLYGFAGLAAQNVISKARAWFQTAGPNAPVGRTLSRIEVLYLEQPTHGAFHIEVDGKEQRRVETAGPAGEAGIARLEVPDGPHRVDIVSEAKLVRLLGVILERQKPGVVVDSLGIGGVNTQLLVRGNRKLTIETLKLRRPDLIVLITGATEPDVPQHMDALRKLIARHQEAVPNAPFVLMSPPDLAGGTIDEPTKVVRITQVGKEKRKVAEEKNTMWWDFHAAMGGDLSIVRFAERKMAWSDFIHLTESGGRYMGRRFAYALVKDFARWAKEHPRAGCSETP